MSKLAILGGTPVRPNNDIQLGWPYATKHDEENIKAASVSERNGSEYNRFAERFARDNETKYCIPVANGTVSLELILRGLGIGYGDEVILPPYTFIASMSSIIFACATPVFADIDLGSYNISPDHIEEKITPRTKAIIAVCVGGRPCDFERLQAIADKHGIYLIIDAAQAVGARFNYKPVGKYGIAASFSCQNSKNLTSGEGGIITTDNDELYNNICSILGTANTRTQFGLDHGLSELQAALLNTQYDKLPNEVAIRSQRAAYLEGLIEGNPFIYSRDYDDRIQIDAHHVHIMRINYQNLAEYGLDRGDFLAALNAEGFPISVGYMPLYSFECTADPAIKKATGGAVDLTPLPNCEIASYKEGCWMYHSVLLGSHQNIRDIADIINKVTENIEDLRK